jgi:hypothetical protein
MTKLPTEDNFLGRPIGVRGMTHAPVSEQGVVFLFGLLAPHLGFNVDRVQVRFPDCIATLRGKRLRIEFEFWASHFVDHRHDAKGVDLVVCWENDWEPRPKKFSKIKVLSLKDYAGAMPRVFVVGCKGPKSVAELERQRIEWNVPQSAQEGDLVLMYRAGDLGAHIADIWEVQNRFAHYKPGNREGMKAGRQARLKNVVRLKKPLSFALLASHSSTKNLGVVRKRFINMTDVTQDWPILHNHLVRLNPQVRRALERFW